MRFEKIDSDKTAIILPRWNSIRYVRQSMEQDDNLKVARIQTYVKMTVKNSGWVGSPNPWQI